MRRLPALTSLLQNKPLTKQVKEAERESNAVFISKVLKVTENLESGYTLVKFQIIDLRKGNHSKVITILTGIDDGNCRYRFEVDKTYLVYAHNSTMYSSLKSLKTTMCSRTKSFSDAKADVNISTKSRNSQMNKKIRVIFPSSKP